MSETIFLKGLIQEIEGKRVVATEQIEDRDGEVISVKGIDLKNYKGNPVLLFAHDHRSLPVGTAEKVRKESERITFEPKISDATQFSRDVKALWDEGVLKTVSIGFIPLEREGNIITKSELLEISIVNVPANPAAMNLAKQKGLNLELLKEAPGNPNLKTTDKEWDEQAAKNRVKEWSDGDFEKYKQAFAYRNEEDVQSFSSCKLMFADVDEGELKAFWQAVQRAQGDLLTNTPKLPEEDRRKAHSLLGKYYKAFNKEQPEFKEYDVHELVEMDLISKQTAYDMLALHRKSGESAVTDGDHAERDEVDAEAKSDDVQLLIEALNVVHLAMQKVNKMSNFSLKTINDVRRKQE